jgi:hypothetical protein
VVDRGHRQVDGLDARPADAEGAQGAVPRQVARREVDLPATPAAHGIHRPTARSNSDWVVRSAPDAVLVEDAAEIAGPARATGMSAPYDHERQRPLQQRQRVDPEVQAPALGPASMAEATMQPKLCPIRWNRTSRSFPTPAEVAQEPMGRPLAELPRQVLHLPERERPQRREQPAEGEPPKLTDSSSCACW